MTTAPAAIPAIIPIFLAFDFPLETWLPVSGVFVGTSVGMFVGVTGPGCELVGIDVDGWSTVGLGVGSGKLSVGFGVSIGLPKYGSSMIINQTYRVNKGGTIYASYQHAKSTISLANSKNYTLSHAGFGGVFKFSGVAVNIYDQMSGVSIIV